MQFVGAVAIAVGVVIAGALIGGRYDVVAVHPSVAASAVSERGHIYIVDRFTGAARICAGNGCREVANIPNISN